MITDQNYPADPRDSMTPGDIEELTRLDVLIRTQFAVAKAKAPIKWKSEPNPKTGDE